MHQVQNFSSDPDGAAAHSASPDLLVCEARTPPVAACPLHNNLPLISVLRPCTRHTLTLLHGVAYACLSYNVQEVQRTKCTMSMLQLNPCRKCFIPVHRSTSQGAGGGLQLSFLQLQPPDSGNAIIFHLFRQKRHFSNRSQQQKMKKKLYLLNEKGIRCV